MNRRSNANCLLPAAADLLAFGRLTNSDEKENIIINRPGRSTYPKKKSVLTSGATPLGHEDIEDMHRLEFQIEREALVQLQVDTVDDLLARLPSIWLYCVGDWLRLKVPNTDDSTRSRWPDQPLWLELRTAWENSQNAVPASRCRRERLPSDGQFFLQGLGGLTGFMASRGITNLEEGKEAFFEAAKQFHSRRKQPLRPYVDEKVLGKARQYGTIKTRIKTAAERLDDVEVKEAYERASRGK